MPMFHIIHLNSNFTKNHQNLQRTQQISSNKSHKHKHVHNQLDIKHLTCSSFSATAVIQYTRFIFPSFYYILFYISHHHIPFHVSHDDSIFLRLYDSKKHSRECEFEHETDTFSKKFIMQKKKFYIQGKWDRYGIEKKCRSPHPLHAS